jgi:S-(hydroxymethyl)glutathione dehydrogenase / alcohol dehydrogenase
MKALVLNALGRGFDLEDVDIAAPMGREVLVEVRASGLCHTDLLFATHDFVPMPAVLGHEVAGIVAAVGSDVTQLRAGDHVVGSLAQSCGACARCLSGRSFQCKHPESTLRRPTDAPRLSRNGVALFQGFGLGGFAERALIHENQLALVPKELPFAQAALLGCGVVTGAGAVLNTAHVAPGDTVVIFGAGGVGLNAVSGARIAGASRIPDVEIAMNVVSAIGGQKRVQGVSFGSTNFKRDIPTYAALYLQGRMNLDDLVSRRIALRDVNDGYASLKDGSLNRVVVTSF